MDSGCGQRAIVIGAGPGGLATAIALRRVGIVAHVYERADTLHGGAGLTLWSNALRALQALGLDEIVRFTSRPLESIGMSTSRGERLFHTSLRNLPLDRHRQISVTIHREELLAVLAHALGESMVHLDHTCRSLYQDGQKVHVGFTNGVEVQADLVVGADGIASVVRPYVLGETRLHYTGYTVWRAVTEYPLDRNLGLTSLGRGCQFGFFPMTRDRVYWFASANAAAGTPDPPGGRKRELLDRFEMWHPPIPALISATEESSILRNDILDRDPVPNWTRGQVTLVGDAAHPAAPTLGQGACQALEDAVILARCLQEGTHMREALSAYVAQREPRTRAITLESRRLGWIGQWENRAACWLRDQLICRTPARIRQHQLAKQFNFPF